MTRLSQWIGLGFFLLTVGATLGIAYLSAGDRAQTHVIDFVRGDQPAAAADAQIEMIAARLASDESLEAVITGHTGTIGDTQANQALSETRARTVRTLIVDAMRAEGDDARDRIRVFGAGGSDPLVQEADESDRAYQRRLARATVEISVALP